MLRKTEVNTTVVDNERWFRLSRTCLLRGFGEREFDGSTV